MGFIATVVEILAIAWRYARSAFARFIGRLFDAEKLREFLVSPAGGRAIGAVVTLVAIVGAYLGYRSYFKNEVAAMLLSDRVYICSETGKTFRVDVKPGMTTPIDSPASGKKTGYPAEFCFWTRDGRIKPEPTYVLLNTYVHKPGPTICPDCGRVVSPMNPMPRPGDTPPPRGNELKTRNMN